MEIGRLGEQRASGNREIEKAGRKMRIRKRKWEEMVRELWKRDQEMEKGNFASPFRSFACPFAPSLASASSMLFACSFWVVAVFAGILCASTLSGSSGPLFHVVLFAG